MPDQIAHKSSSSQPDYRRQAAIGIAFGLAGFVLNWFKLEFFFNVDFIFGSILSMFALMRFGLVAGMTATLIAASCTSLLWHHPWAVIIFCAETLCTSQLRLSKDRDPVLNNVAYWFSGGIALVLFFYAGVMHFPLLPAMVMGLKQGINGIVNTLIAAALHMSYGFYRRRQERLPGLRQLIFVAISLFVTIPTLFSLYLDIRHTMRQDLARHQEATVRIATAAQTGAASWLDSSLGVIRFLASSGGGPVADMRRDLENMRHSLADFRRLGMTDERGITIAFSPAVDENGAATVGLDLSDRSFLKKVSNPPYPEVMELFQGRIGAPGPRLILAAPVLEKERYRGAVFGVVDLGTLKELLQKLVHEDSVQVTLVDDRGMVVLSTKHELRPLTPYALPTGGSLIPVAKGIRHWIPDPKPGLSPYKRWLASFYVKEMPLDGYPGWKLVVESPLRRPITALSEKITAALSGIGLLLALLVFCSRLFAGRIASILSDFERVTRELPAQIAAGATIEWPLPVTSELKGLTDNVQVMTRELVLSHAALKQLNQSLEQRVEERTAQLRESQQLLNAIIETTPDPISVKDCQGAYLMMNKAGLEFLGREAIGREETRIYAPEEEEVILAYDRRVLETGAIVSFEQSRRNHLGESRVFNVVKGPIRDHAGAVTGIFAISRDITDRIQMEDQLEQERSLLRTIISTIPDLIFLKDVNGVFLAANPAFQEMAGHPEAEIVGRTDYDIWNAEEAELFARRDREVLAAGRQIAHEEWLTDSSGGRRILLETKKTPMLDRAGNQLGILGIARDITVQHEAKEELKRAVAERTADLRRLAERIEKVADHERASVAQEIHDELGQLLAALMMDVAWFQKRIPEGDEKFAAKVKAMNDLLNVTIQCARRITRDLRPRMLDELGLVAAIEEQLELYRQRQIDCRLIVPQRDAQVDPERANSLFRIFQESMTNVMRHSDATRAEILLDIRENGIVLQVEDNGRGINEEQINNLQSLGLLGIKERALRWGGTAEIRGSRGKGTTIRVEMPVERRRKKR